jgi:hypothetical protein
MIEVLPQTIYPVMTIKTGRAKRQCMRRHERRIGLTVTCVTGFQRKCGDIVLMAIIAGKDSPRRRSLVTV